MSYTLEDWLALHELNLEECSHLVHYIENAANTEDSGKAAANPELTNLTADEVWAFSARGLADRFPLHASLISDVENNVTTLFNPDTSNQRHCNFTVDQGKGLYPYVCVHYQSRPVDILTVAHEFSHALQLVVCDGKFMPPVAREMCAFAGELTVLRHMSSLHIDLHESVQRSWHLQNNLYFGKQLALFKLALQDLKSPYNYIWNYPIARVLSIIASEKMLPDGLWGMFEGKGNLSQLARELAVGA